jgi:hypothetical protein
MRRWAKIAAGGFAFLLYTWVAAVGTLGRVRAAKRARRAARAAESTLT